MVENRSSNATRPFDVFLKERGLLLADRGFTPDPGRIERNDSSIVFYHYTRPEHLDKITAPQGGLWARLSVPTGDTIPQFANCYLTEAFLEPLPQWVYGSPFFGDLTLEMMRQYVGNLLLRIELPEDFPGVYVADYAHTLESKHIQTRGYAALRLGYDTQTGHESTKAFVNSYILAASYRGGHVCPNVQIVRHQEGIVVPSEFISVHTEQPLGA